MKISEYHQQLIQFLRIALLETTDDNVVGNIINSTAIFCADVGNDLSIIAFDGYQKIQHLLCSQALPMRDWLDWIGKTNYQERQYEAMLETTSKLAKMLDDNNLTTFVLKGMSLAQCYPIPSHRYSCDFDCILINKDRKQTNTAYEEGNKILEQEGVKVDRNYYKNSSFYYEGVHVENHRFCCSVKRGKRTMELEKYLQVLLKECSPTYYKNTRLAQPPLMFQALFLMEHACAHFLYNKMSLKNIYDWAMFKKHYHSQMNWEEFDSQCIRFGLKNFADSMNHLTDSLLGICEESQLSSHDIKVLEDTLEDSVLPQNKMLQRIHKINHAMHSSWKFKYFSQDSMSKELFHSFVNFFFKINKI